MKDSYRTTDLPLSAFLHALGHTLIGVSSNTGRGVFVFENSPDLQTDVLRWANNELVLIQVRGFVNAQRDLKGMVSV